ncbi:hypothetical protein BC332_07184 [Capsicum chinense]|nr:hypothetical protein BC332_07184 [Capsicum chinense]
MIREGSKSSPTCCGTFGRERVDIIEAPLGFYGPWPAFALTYHLVIWFVVAQVYPGVPFKRYAILGDNIIIRDERVDEHYHELIPPLNVPFLLEKLFVSSIGVLGFAKRFFIRGVIKDFFPISCDMLISLVISISPVLVIKAIMSNNLPLSYCLREAGYRVYTRSTTPLYDGSKKGVQKDFINLKQRNISVNEYSLKFTQLEKYASAMVTDYRAQMRKFMSGAYEDVVKDFRTSILVKEMDISRLMVHAQLIEEEKIKVKERVSKRARIGSFNFSLHRSDYG